MGQPEAAQGAVWGFSWAQQAGVPWQVMGQHGLVHPSVPAHDAELAAVPTHGAVHVCGLAQTPVTLQHVSVFRRGQSSHLASTATCGAALGPST